MNNEIIHLILVICLHWLGKHKRLTNKCTWQSKPEISNTCFQQQLISVSFATNQNKPLDGHINVPFDVFIFQNSLIKITTKKTPKAPHCWPFLRGIHCNAGSISIPCWLHEMWIRYLPYLLMACIATESPVDMLLKFVFHLLKACYCAKFTWVDFVSYNMNILP